MLRLLDLFSGIGGFSLGLERTHGFRTVAFCEIGPYARRVLARHWPEVPCYDDVRTVTADRLAADGIAVDVICGGFPCQDLSVAGAGAGLDGSRSSLWFEMLRVIEEVRPRWVIVENVPALRSRGLETVLGGLAEIGLSVEWHCIPAAALGAPHRRDRIWIIAHPGSDPLRLVEQRLSARRQVGICDKGQAVTGDDGATQSVADALRHGLQGGEPAIQADMRRRLADQGGAGDVADTDRNAGHERGVGDGEEGPGGRNTDRGGIRSDVADASQPGLPLSERETILGARWREERRAIAERGWWASESGIRGSPDGLSGRLDGGLNAWGPDWEDGITRVASGVPHRVDRLRCLGNAIVPQVAELIGHAILGATA